MELLSVGGAVGSAILSIFKAGYFVKTGEIGAVTTFGAVNRTRDGKIKLLGPGFKMVIPFAQTIVKVHTRKRTSNFSNWSITLKNGLSYTFDAYMVYHVKSDPQSVENILFSLQDYEQYILTVFERAVQTSLQDLERIDNKGINEKLVKSLKPILDKEGVELDDCGLISFTATEQSQQLLSINFKLDIAEKSNLDKGVLSAILGAVPMVSAGKVTEQPKKQEDKNATN